MLNTGMILTEQTLQASQTKENELRRSSEVSEG